MSIFSYGIGAGIPALRPVRKHVPEFLYEAFDVVVQGNDDLGAEQDSYEELARLVASGPPPGYPRESKGGGKFGPAGYPKKPSVSGHPWDQPSQRQLMSMVGAYQADQELREMAAAGRVGADEEIMGLDASAATAAAQQVFNAILAVQAPKIAAVVNAAGLNKPFWTKNDVDKVAVPLIQSVKAAGSTPTADDAALARGAAKAFQVQRGGAVEGWDVMGDDVVGDLLGTIGNVMKAPLKAAAWLGNKGVDASIWATRQSLRPVMWAGKKVFGGGGGAPQQMPGMMPMGPVGMSPQQMQMYQQAAARKAAASQRILAAEASHAASLAQQQQAMDLQDAQLQAQDAEEAAATAERIAMQAQAGANLPATPESLMGLDTLDSDLMSFKKNPISWRAEMGDDWAAYDLTSGDRLAVEEGLKKLDKYEREDLVNATAKIARKQPLTLKELTDAQAAADKAGLRKPALKLGQAASELHAKMAREQQRVGDAWAMPKLARGVKRRRHVEIDRVRKVR